MGVDNTCCCHATRFNGSREHDVAVFICAKELKKREKDLHISEFHEAAVIYSLDTETKASTKQKASKDLRSNTSSFAVFTCSA